MMNNRNLLGFALIGIGLCILNFCFGTLHGRVEMKVWQDQWYGHLLTEGIPKLDDGSYVLRYGQLAEVFCRKESCVVTLKYGRL